MALQQERETQRQVVRSTLLRIGGHKGVIGYMVLNPKDGSVMECVGFGNDKDMTERYADVLYGFVQLTQSTVRTLDRDDDLTFLRMRWRLREILIAPDLNKEYTLVVVQDQALPEEEKPQLDKTTAGGGLDQTRGESQPGGGLNTSSSAVA